MSNPKVLLLGNGINRIFEEDSWDNLLYRIAEYDDDTVDDTSDMPAPLRAIYLSRDQINVKMKALNEKYRGSIDSEGKTELLQRLLDLDFDEILTTNYSYELEMAATGKTRISDNALKKMAQSTVDRVEPKYLIHTFNQIEWRGNPKRIWHIHGEARKPDSMLLGHYYYGNQTARIKQYLDRLGASYLHEQQKYGKNSIRSWIDAFILGDVYVLGCGLDFSELDLWWLLNRKKREKAEHGGFFFYEPFTDENYHKRELISLFSSGNSRFREVENCGFSGEVAPEEWSIFYKNAIEDIEKKLKDLK